MKKLFVYDIDGTVANTDHRVAHVRTKPKNWGAFFAAQEKDEPYEDIIWTVRQYYDAGHNIIFCSGRSEAHRNVTTLWLAKYNIPYHRLYMRPDKDNRKDSIVKVELMKQIEKDFGSIFMWFDDRTQVVDALRENGVRVLQVRPGDF